MPQLLLYKIGVTGNINLIGVKDKLSYYVGYSDNNAKYVGNNQANVGYSH